MMAKRSPTTMASIRADLQAARDRVVELEAGEAAAEQKSDEAFAAWLRQKRLADREVSRLTELAAQAERDAKAADAQAKLDEYHVEYTGCAAENREVERMKREDVPQAWATIAMVMEREALAEKRTQAVIRAMPDGYEPREWIGDPDRSVRCGPPQSYEVVSDKIVNLWVDPDTGGIFANQDQTTHSAVKKAFRELRYRPFLPVSEPLKFYQALRMPRLNAVGDHFLYDGSLVRTPDDVLAALRKARSRPAAKERPILTKIEPIEKPATSDASSLPPPLST